MKEYKKRIADELLKKKLKGKGAVLIQGPKWCGKTTTAEQISNSVLYMDNPEEKKQNISLANLKPKKFRGVTSHGMLLLADNGETLSLMTTEKGFDAGCAVN